MAHLKILLLAGCFCSIVCIISAKADREQAGLEAQGNGTTRLRRASSDYDDLGLCDEAGPEDALNDYEDSRRYMFEDGRWAETASWSRRSNGNYAARISQGHPAADNQFPYVVEIKVRRGFSDLDLCTGVILNDRMILTAAYCVYSW